MQKESIRILVFSIAASGALMAVAGVGLFLMRDLVLRRDLVRFVAPIPPILVAAYVYVVNFFSHFGNDTATAGKRAVLDTLAATGVSAALFVLLSLGLIGVVAVCDRIL